MLKTLGIVEVRREALRERTFARKLGGMSILERVVRRATDCQRLDAVVVLAPDDATLVEVRRLARTDVAVVSPAAGDTLGKFAALLEQHHAAAFVHIGADNPFVDPALIDRMVTTAEVSECDYLGYCRADGRPAILTHLGMFAEWCSTTALLRAHRAARLAAQRDHATAFIYGHPELFKLRLIPLPAELDREDLRLKIVGEEELEHAQAIYDALGHDEWDWREVAELLDQQPALRRRMAQLNRAKQPA